MSIIDKFLDVMRLNDEKKCVKIKLSLRKNRESWVKSRKNE